MIFRLAEFISVNVNMDLGYRSKDLVLSFFAA